MAPHIPTAMKLLSPDSSALIAVMMISLGTGPAARSTNVTIDGSGFTDLNSSVRYFGGEVKQSGRFTSLGINHYSKAEFGVKWKGFAILLRQKRFPEINLWEHTRKGWKWRDKLSLKQARWL